MDENTPPPTPVFLGARVKPATAAEIHRIAQTEDRTVSYMLRKAISMLIATYPAA